MAGTVVHSAEAGEAPRTLSLFARHYWHLSGLLTAVASLLWTVSLFRLSHTGLKLDDMGYVHTLPLTFWTGIALLTVGSALLWQAPREHKGMLALQLCMLITMFWLTPLFLGNTVSGTRYSFGLDNCTKYIMRYGHLDTASEWYHNWPAFNLIEAALLYISGIVNLDSFIIWAQAPIQFVVVLFLYLFFKQILGQGNQWAAAAWFFILFNWTAQTYYSPQALGIILLLTLFFLLSKGLTEDGAKAQLLPLGILVIVGLVVTHLLTALTGLFVVAIFEMMAFVKKRRLPTLTPLFITLILTWETYYGGLFLKKALPGFLKQVMNFELMWSRNVTRVIAGSAGHLAVVNLRIWLTLAAGAIGLGGLALSRKIKAPGDGLALAMGTGILVILPFQFYGNEFLSRLFIYSLPIIAYFAAKLIRTKVTALFLTLSLIAALPFGIVGLHGNAMTDDVTLKQLAYWHLLEARTERGNLGLGGMTIAWSFGYADYRYVKGFDEVFGYGSKWPERLAIRGWVEPNMPNYLGFSGYEEAAFRMWTDFPEGVSKLTAQANGLSDLTLFYENGEVKGYYHNGVKLPSYPLFEPAADVSPAGG